MKNILQAQYVLVRDARNVLLQYCESINPQHFIQELEGFGKGGSMRNLLVHIGNSYEGWLAKRALARNVSLTSYDHFPDISACRTFFVEIDNLMDEFLIAFEDDFNRALIMPLTGDQTITASPFKIFLHVITHEFHHKGQILSISRQLGCVPVDTDVLR